MEQSVKGLNKGPGGRRFVFKSFAQRLEEVDVDVFRSLEPVKFEPTQGSSFFHENLVRWRELNSAADFISLYEELMPVVQTLPQLLLHKEMILAKLLSRVHMQARLSLEPILSLIAILSRDLRAEFMPFLSQIIESFVSLLRSGGDRDPEIIEQVFTSISYVMKYMQKLLVKDVSHVINITKQLRCYHREYVQEFTAEAVSFLLRNSSVKQLIKGIQKVIGEVAIKPSKEKTTGCSALLWHTLKGPASRFHSRAEQVLRLLLDKLTYSKAIKKGHGVNMIIEVVMGTFQRLCGELNREDLRLLWDCLLEETSCLLHNSCVEGVNDVDPESLHHLPTKEPLADTIMEEQDNVSSRHALMGVGDIKKKEDFIHLSRVLSLLNVILEFQNGSKVNDYKQLFALAGELVKLLISSLWTPISREDSIQSVASETCRFLLALVHNHARVGGVSVGPIAIINVSVQWAPVFQGKDDWLLPFIRGLLDEDLSVMYPFSPYIISALDNYIEASPADVISLLVKYVDKIQTNPQYLSNLGGKDGKITRNICSFLIRVIETAAEKMNARKVDKEDLDLNSLLPEAPNTWGALKCYPYFFSSEDNASLLWEYALAIDKFLIAETENVKDHSRKLWESMIGSTLRSHLKLLRANTPILSKHMCDYINFARRYRLSPHVLSAVADFLDAVLGSTECINNKDKKYHLELRIDKTANALILFTGNLGMPDKNLRLSTLRLLSHYEPFCVPKSEIVERPDKRRKIEGVKTNDEASDSCSNVIQQILSIETTPMSLVTSRQATVLISKIQIDLCAGRIPDLYISILFHGLIGVLHNRFGLLWDPVVECIVVLLERHQKLIWDDFVHYLGRSQALFLALPEGELNLKSNVFGGLKDLDDQFRHFIHHGSECTAVDMVVSLLMHVAQKVPKLAETRSRQIIPLFLSFLGYFNQDIASVNDYDENKCKGKQWKNILKEWLILIQKMRNSKSFFKGHFLKEILINRLLEQNDPDVQLKVLQCLMNWKDGFLLPYEEHLKNLISLKEAREEVTTWSLSKERQQIQDCHRGELIPIVIRLLISKVKKIKAISSKKSAGALQRKAVLCFLANLEVNELALFFSLLVKSFQSAFMKEHVSIYGSKYSWEVAIEQGATWDFVQWISTESVASIPYKNKSGFLHVVKDVLETFSEEQVTPYLVPLLALILHILQSCAQSLEHQKESTFGCNIEQGSEAFAESKMTDVIMLDDAHNTHATREANQLSVVVSDDTLGKLDATSVLSTSASSETQITSVMASEGKKVKPSSSLFDMKDLRSLCLKVIAIMLNKYDSFDFGSVFWDIFFTAIKPLVDKFRQESGSSETPSSLFTCFLAMSESRKLASFLQREKMLVPNILAILSVKGVSESMISAVLTFVENLLDLDDINNEDQDKALLEEILLPHLDILFTSMQNLIQLRHKKRRKNTTGLGKRVLRLFQSLGKYVTNSEAVNQFIDGLLPFLDVKKDRNDEHYIEILSVVKAVLPALEDGISLKMLNTFSSLLTSATLDVRLAICDILRRLAEKDSSLAFVAELVWELNAMSPDMIGEYDCDKRLFAYEKIASKKFTHIGEPCALLILSHCVYDLSSQELSLRDSASACLLSFIEFSGTVLGSKEDVQQNENQDDQSDKKNNHGKDGSGTIIPCMIENKNNWSKISVKRVIYRFFLLHLRNSMTTSETAIQREWMVILRAMVTNLSDITTLNELKPLSSTDLEVDFFSNILHIQKHRRAKAMTRLRNLVDARNLSEEILMQIFVPLLFNMLLESKSDKEGHVISSCIETLACISGRIRWESYFSLLMRSFRLMASKHETNKRLVRLICSLLDSFCFVERNSSYIDLDKQDHQTEHKEIVRDERIMDLSNSCDKDIVISPQIQERLQKSILPEMNKIMISNSDVVNVSVSLAAVKLLKLMPKGTMESELPRIIQQIANLLKSRADSVRDEARTALAACAKELGPQYLQLIIKALRTTLKRGYELHVLGYTMNFILSKFQSSLDIGDIDYCLQGLLEIAENDIMGEVAQEKEVEKIASKMKETKNSKSYESLQLISQNITFHRRASALLKPVEHNLHKTLAPKEKVKVESMLRYIAAGLQSNISLGPQDLLVFVYGLVEDGLQDEKIGRRTDFITSPEMESSRSTNSSNNLMKGTVDDIDAPNRYVITVFALRLLEHHLKHIKADKNDHHIISMLDPFLELLHQCLKSKYEGVISQSVKCLALLLRFHLPSIDILGGNITSLVFDMVQRSGKIHSPLMQSSINLLIVLLRYANTTMSDVQLKMLLQSPVFIDLESSSNTIALSLLKAIIGRKLMVPDLYDLITRVAHLMVTSQIQPIRKQCSQILLKFLLDYPLGEKRLQQHIDFLVANLSYEHTCGREAVLEMLHVIIQKFPSNVVDEQAETFFLPLVARLVNDNDKGIRAMVGYVLKELIGRVSQRPLQRMLTFGLLWYKGEKKQLWCPAAQVLGLLIEVMKKSFQAHVEDVRSRAIDILKCAVAAASNEKSEAADIEMLAFWQEAYYSLIMLEKLLHQSPEISLHKDFEEIWDLICSLLVHPHVWLQNISGRLIAIYFSTCGSEVVTKSQANGKTAMLLQPSRLLLLAASFCHQLDMDMDLLDNCMGDMSMVVENLVYVTCALYSFVKSRPQVDLKDFFSTLDAHNQSLIMEALALLGSKTCTKVCACLLSREKKDVSELEDKNEFQDLETSLYEPIFKKMGKIARQAKDLQTKAVFKWYKAISTHQGHEGIQRYGSTILLPLYKIIEGYAGNVVSGNLKLLAEEVLNHMKDIMGVEGFVQAYNLVRQKVKATHSKRKQTEKVSALVNPIRHAQKKRKLAVKRQAQKKRKVMKTRMQRS
ncbi:uncharacterized protein LOC131074886 isoform X2 [Cryptomeria japonica]|uniref:uncharacterized protein LOC131074886 isoform X2 n=1 Tax=Cryptomeria japonica TaxID=3369 RepID=UPI0027DA7CA0|nr:uncharacterized protein LOC131074886 isoform X2 [Cryptomeria japonica]